jgi:hypothetical protein
MCDRNPVGTVAVMTLVIRHAADPASGTGEQLVTE